MGITDLLLPFRASVFAPLRPSQLADYRDAWMYFQYVGQYNFNIQQQRTIIPNAEVSYFRFPSMEDKQKYTKGLQLYLRVYPEYQYNLAEIIPLEI
jgi:hypothetical protein